jgi:hypothetical protein
VPYAAAEYAVRTQTASIETDSGRPGQSSVAANATIEAANAIPSASTGTNGDLRRHASEIVIAAIAGTITAFAPSMLPTSQISSWLSRNSPSATRASQSTLRRNRFTAWRT